DIGKTITVDGGSITNFVNQFLSGGDLAVNSTPTAAYTSAGSSPPPATGSATLLYEDTFTSVDLTKYKTIWYYTTANYVRGYNNEEQAYVKMGTTLATTLKNNHGYEPLSIDANGDLLIRAIRTPSAIASSVGNAPWLSGM